MTFLDDDLSQVSGQYDDLLSIDQVIDEQLILFVSLNINKKTEAVRSLGKMLLQNIQLSSANGMNRRIRQSGAGTASSRSSWTSFHRLATGTSLGS